MMNAPLKRSQLGIASFLISIGTFISIDILMVIALMVSGKKSHGVSEIFGQFAFYCFFIGVPLAHLIGLILGIIALFQKRSAKGFAIFGVILNLFFPALGVLIIFILLSAVAYVR